MLTSCANGAPDNLLLTDTYRIHSIDAVYEICLVYASCNPHNVLTPVLHLELMRRLGETA